MLRNIFRHRRRSKNGPESEPVTHIEPVPKTILPVDTHHEEGSLSSQQGPDKQGNLPTYDLYSTENVSSATDIRYKHLDTEYINRATSSSQVTGLGAKYNSGHQPDRRQRLSSVVNMILSARSESKPTPRTRKMVASHGFWTNEQADRNAGILASDKRYDEEDTDSVFTVPYLCQHCSGFALHGESSKERPQDSWTCLQCRMQPMKGRDRHVSAESSQAALPTPALDSLKADSSDRPCQPKDFSRKQDNSSHNQHCSRDCRCGYCANAVCGSTYGKGQYYSAENVIDCDSTPSHRNASHVPSPLLIGDLKCDESELLGDDDAIPELVEISPHRCCSNHSHIGDANTNISSLVVQATIEAGGKNVNESEMYILTDSFLDDSFASFMHTAAAPESAQSTTVGHLLSEVMVADDYQLTYPSKTTSYGNTHNLHSLMEPAGLPVISPQFTVDVEKLCPEPTEGAATPEEQMWCRKSLLEWSTDDVLHWVVDVGLEQFYDIFCSKLLHTYSV